jgi:hypothetical protein
LWRSCRRSLSRRNRSPEQSRAGGNAKRRANDGLKGGTVSVRIAIGRRAADSEIDRSLDQARAQTGIRAMNGPKRVESDRKKGVKSLETRKGAVHDAGDAAVAAEGAIAVAMIVRAIAAETTGSVKNVESIAKANAVVSAALAESPNRNSGARAWKKRNSRRFPK